MQCNGMQCDARNLLSGESLAQLAYVPDSSALLFLPANQSRLLAARRGEAQGSGSLIAIPTEPDTANKPRFYEFRYFCTRKFLYAETNFRIFETYLVRSAHTIVST